LSAASQVRCRNGSPPTPSVFVTISRVTVPGDCRRALGTVAFAPSPHPCRCKPGHKQTTPPTGNPWGPIGIKNPDNATNAQRRGLMRLFGPISRCKMKTVLSVFLVATAGLLAAGCGRSTSGSSVTGSVTFKGNPVTGGTMLFHGKDKPYPASLGADGKYTCPVIP